MMVAYTDHQDSTGHIIIALGKKTEDTLLQLDLYWDGGGLGQGSAKETC